jgi:uncharacterized protein (TIGR03083 family)
VTVVVDALGAECDAFCAALDDVRAADWSVVTNCPPWTVKELVAHVYGSTMLDPSRMRTPADDAPVVATADYYRRPERDTAQYRQDNVDHWQRFAARFVSGSDVASACVRDWPPMIDRLRVEDRSRLIAMFGGMAMTVDDYLVTRVIGVAAHGVDLAITLDRPRWTTSAALRVVRPAFVALLGEEPPASLAWSDQDLLETGTGRRPLTVEERKALGPRADVFPLLS